MSNPPTTAMKVNMARPIDAKAVRKPSSMAMLPSISTAITAPVVKPGVVIPRDPK
jgi:hypothetical protein